MSKNWRKEKTGLGERTQSFVEKVEAVSLQAGRNGSNSFLIGGIVRGNKQTSAVLQIARRYGVPVASDGFLTQKLAKLGVSQTVSGEEAKTIKNLVKRLGLSQK